MSEEEEPIADEGGLDSWMEFSPEPEAEAPSRRLHPITVVTIVIGIAVAAGLVALRPTGASLERAERQLSVLGVPNTFIGAEIASVATDPCEFDSDADCTTVVFAITEGPDVGESHTQVFAGGGVTPDFDTGDHVVLAYRAPNARVTVFETGGCSYDEAAPCAQFEVVMTSGDVLGARYTTELPLVAADLRVGDDVIVTFDESGEVLAVAPLRVENQYQFADFQRRSVLLILAVVFAAAVIALGGWRGVAALAGLGATILIVLVWLIPAILDGRSPVLVALVGAAAVSYIALYVAHGISLMTTVALLGTLSALLLTTVLSMMVVGAAKFTGFTTEESTLLVMFENIDVGGLLLAGMVLGAAGALDDVTVTQSSAIWQFRAADPGMSRDVLYGRGLRIGRAHIGSTVNTLLLAYLGAALPLAILFILAQQSLGAVANSEVVAVEITRTLVGSIGLVAAVPVTTWLAARVASERNPAGDPAHTH